MPSYDFRCGDCAHEFTQHYKRIRDYQQATPRCPQCDGIRLERLIHRVNVAGAKAHDFANMSSQQMLSVLESGDERAVKTLYEQVGAQPTPDDKPATDKPRPS